MRFSIAHPRSQRMLASLGAAVLLGVGLMYGPCNLAWACDASLDFVGHLISGLYDISLNRLDPTCPQCF